MVKTACLGDELSRCLDAFYHYRQAGFTTQN